MALQVCRVGNIEDAIQWEDTVHDGAIETTQVLKAGAPVAANDVVILGAGTPGAVTPVPVVDIDDPSAELNALAGVIGSAIMVYELEAASNQYTIYGFDAGDTGGEDVPYSVDALTSGLWIAIAGKYFNNSIITKGHIGIGVAPGAFEIYIQDAATPTILLEDTTNTCQSFLSAANLIGYTGTLSNHDFNIQTNNIDRVGITSLGVTNIGDAGVTNYASFAVDGELTLLGTARVIKEVKLTAGSFAPGASGAAQVTIFGRYSGWAFTINDDMIAVFEIPFDWDTTANLEVKIYWYIDEAYATANGEVQWEVNWAAIPSNNTEAMDAPTHSGTIDYGDQNIPANAKYLTKTAAGVIAAASLSEGDLIGINVVRKVLDGGVNPTAEPVMAHLEVEYRSNKLGEAT